MWWVLEGRNKEVLGEWRGMCWVGVVEMVVYGVGAEMRKLDVMGS